MKVAVVAREDVCAGFMLAGVREVYRTPKDMLKLLERGDIAVVFYQNDFLKSLPRKERMRIEESVKPIFVPLEGEEGIKELMRRVIGIEVE